MLTPQGNHPPVAAPLGERVTDRLELRRFRDGDLDALAEVFAQPEVWRFPYGRGFDRAQTAVFLEGQIRHWESCGFGLWLAVERTSGRTLGFVGLSVPTFLPEILPAVEVGWRLEPAAWGKGYASEGARAALQEGFTTLGLERICSLPQSVNPASCRVAERIGMHRERTVCIPPTPLRGAVDGELYWLTRDAWRRSATHY